MKFFYTAGPVKANCHYCFDPLARVDLDDVLTLIHQEKYFVLHAPRQTGKTSTLLALAENINREGRYRCVYINVEAGQAAQEDVSSAMRTILWELAKKLKTQFTDTTLLDELSNLHERSASHSVLRFGLTLCSDTSPKPLVLLMN